MSAVFSARENDFDPTTWTNAISLVSFLFAVSGSVALLSLPLSATFAMIGLRQTKRRGQAGGYLAVLALALCALQAIFVGLNVYQQYRMNGHMELHALIKA